MIRLEHFYIDVDLLKLKKENIYKLSKDGDYDIVVDSELFREIIIPSKNTLVRGEDSMWFTLDDDTWYGCEFHFMGEEYIVGDSYIREVTLPNLENICYSYDLRKFISWLEFTASKFDNPITDYRDWVN